MLAAGRRLAPLLMRSVRTEAGGPIDETVRDFLPPDVFFTQLKSRGFEFFAGVPDSLLKDLNSYVQDHTPESKHIITVNEGAAIAVGAGYHLATSRYPVIYLQNSGLGNIINPLLSLIDPRVYKIPMLLLIGWRGEPGSKDEPQHMVQGKAMNNLLTDLGVTYEVLPDFEEGAAAALDLATYHLRTRGSAYAFLVRRQTFLKYKGKKTAKNNNPVCREEAIKLILQKTGKFDTFVSTTGFTSRELYELREIAGQGHEQDFYVVGSMGHASSIAQGIALAKPSKTVYCLDGDGAMLMHMGAVAQIGGRPLPNFKHILLNNECHDSVGGQPTIAGKVDFVGLTKACGYKYASSARTEEEMILKIQELAHAEGPAFLELKVGIKTRDNLGRPKSTPKDNKESFMTFLDTLLKPDDFKILESGIPVSESDDDLSDSHSISSLSLDARVNSARSPDPRKGLEAAVKELRGKLAEVTREKTDLEYVLEAQKTSFRNEMKASQEVWEQELQALRGVVKRLQSDAPVLKERIDQLKDDLRDLTITEAYYSELKRRPESERSFKEWLLVKVFELVEKYRSSYDREHLERETLKEQFGLLQDKLARTERELSHKTSASASQIQDLERHQSEIVLENQRAHKQLKELTNALGDNREKVIRFDEVSADLRKTLTDKSRLENQVEAQTKQIDMLVREKQEHLALLDGKGKEMDLLLSDKGYLSKQNGQLLDKVQRLEDRNDRLELEIVEAKNAAQNYLSKLLDMRDNKSVSFEEKLTKELNELRDRHARETEEVRKQLTEVHEKKEDYLREARETSEIRLSKVEETLKETNKMYEELQLEHRLSSSKADEEMSRLRSELRIKSEQLQLLQNSYEQSVQSLRHSKAENEMLKEKVDLLRQEYYKSEHKCTTENADLKAQFAVAQAQLQQYALIEQELDYAIENQGIDIPAPTTSKRRVQQSLALAKKLTEKQKEAETLKAESLHLTSELQRLEEELALSKSLLSQSSQPYSYLVKQLEAREREQTDLRRQVSVLTQQNSDIVVQYDLLERANAEMSRDLRELLSKKQSIEQLQVVLQQLIERKEAGQELDGNEVLAKLVATAGRTQKPAATGGAPGWFNTLKKRLK